MAKKSPTEIDQHVGTRLRTRRVMLGFSQEKVGGACGITFQQVQKMERGTNRISASRLQQLSEILRVPVSYFFEQLPTDNASTSVAKDIEAQNAFTASRDGQAIIQAASKMKPNIRRAMAEAFVAVAGA